jgi:hypothetical protein
MERIGLKYKFSNRSVGEPDLCIYINKTRSGSPNINGNYLIRLRALNPLIIMAVRNTLKSDFFFTGCPNRYYVELSFNFYSRWFYKFNAIIFEEETPQGEVKRRLLGGK